MATRIDVTVPEGAAVTPDEAAKIVFEVFRRVDGWASEWKEGSALTRVNRSAGGVPVVVPLELIRLIQRGLDLSQRSGGTFDITWAALWGVWDFKAEVPLLPDPQLLEARLKKVDYRRVEVDEDSGTLRLPEEGMLIGLGGIAKGYALDRAGEALRARGVDSFNLSAGGQVLTAGLAHLEGEAPRPWRVGIRDPRGGVEDYFASIEVSDASIATSGDYERFFMLDGVRYHHILDLRTGKPARVARSATVLCAEATLADALSTALMVLGPEGLGVVERAACEGVVVDAEGGVHRSVGIGDGLRVRHPPLD
jgi:thiamine biosynthesis lipoprotein